MSAGPTRPRAVVIGNSPSAREHRMGRALDAFDVVVRLNNFVLDGHEDWVGSRTDHAVCSFACTDTPALRALPRERLHLFTGPHHDDADFLRQRLARDDGLHRRLDEVDCLEATRYFHELAAELSLPAGAWASTGAVAIRWAQDTFGATHDLYLYGFSFFRESGEHLEHYFAHRPRRDSRHVFSLERDWALGEVAAGRLFLLAPFQVTPSVDAARFVVVSHRPRDDARAVAASIHQVFLAADAPLAARSAYLDANLEADAFTAAARALISPETTFVFNGVFTMLRPACLELLARLGSLGYATAAYWHETAWTMTEAELGHPALWPALKSTLRAASIEHWVASRAAKQVVARELAVPLERIRVVGEAIVPQRYVRAQRRAKPRYRLVGAGVIGPRKGVDYFVALSRLLASRAPVDLVWYGPGGEARARAWPGDTGQVTFREFDDDFAAVLAGADALLLTSRDDPQPLVGLEALAADLPVFCFDSVGTAELVPRAFVAAGPAEMAEQVLSYLEAMAQYPAGCFAELAAPWSAERFVGRLRQDPTLRGMALGEAPEAAQVRRGWAFVDELQSARQQLRARGHELVRLHRSLDNVVQSRSYRLGYALLGPLRALKRWLERTDTTS